VTVATVGVATLFFPPHSVSGGSIETLLMLGTFAVTLGFFCVSIRRDVRTWVDPAAPFVGFLMVALALHLSGGPKSGLAPLVILPILWLAMMGTRRDLHVAVAVTWAMFVVPIFTIGGSAYPVGDWRRAVIWSAFAAFVAPAIQRLVRQLAAEKRNLEETSTKLNGIMRAARLSSMITTDETGAISSFSVGAEDLLGYKAEQMIGRAGTGIHDPAEVAAVALELGVPAGFGVFTELARRNEPSRIWTYVRADGQRMHVRLALTELRDAEGTFTGLLGVAIDATATVKAEKALALSEARLRAIAELLPDTTLVVIAKDLTINLVTGSGALRQGIEGRVGQKLSDFASAANMELWNGWLSEAFSGREARGDLIATLSGEPCEIIVTPMPPDENGPVALILGRDVSRERAREREVVQAKERAERLFMDAPHGVVLLTTSGVVTQANDAMRAITGPVALEGHPLALLKSPDDHRFDRHLADVLSNPGGRSQTDWTLTNSSGQDVHVVLSSRVLHEESDADDLVLVNVVDVSERHRYQQRLAHLADHDVLTGLANRRVFEEELERHLNRCSRYGPKGAVLLLDLDHFKEVNDTLGHGAGDELIVSVAALLRRDLRASDVVARLGGDEFAILLTEADRASAETVAATIVERIQNHTATLDGTRRRVTASIGVVPVGVATGQSLDLLALADMTMYDAKEAGRNRYVSLGEGANSQPRSGARLQWKGRLEQALEDDNFALHLQPILDLRTGQVASAEALVRLDDSDVPVLPSRFLYIAERTGLVTAVDAWVVEHSIAMLARLRTEAPYFQLEVNLSGLSIGSADIERVIVESLERFEVDPSALILEITETAAVADVEVARQFADRMTSLGCKFALDDFGAGFGSFFYLKHLLFDYVKIDGEFVANCHRSNVDRTILRSIVSIARDLGKQTVAEFVTDEAVLDIVREEGVDLAQGYLIGKPVPYEEFVTHLLAEDGSGASYAR